MIQITRRNIRSIRTMIRQTLGITSSRRAPAITLRCDGNVLRIQTTSETIAIEVRLDSTMNETDSLTIPYQALMNCEGSQEELVSFVRRDNEIITQWSEAGIPQTETFAAGEPVDMPPEVQLSFIAPRFIVAMADAAATTSSEPSRFALNCIRLRGTDGQIAATDSSQALMETGFQFPWSDTVLLPASGVFSSREFTAAEEVQIGRSDDWVMIQTNSCTVSLKIEKERRFPDLDLQRPSQAAAATTLALADADVAFLLESSPRLPAADENNAPVTVQLNGMVAIRAAAEGSDSIIELVLSNSRRIGDEMMFHTDREFLCRAARLGFRNIHFRDNSAPAYCQDDRRNYIWALLNEESALRGSEHVTRISSPVLSDSSTPSKGLPSPMVNANSSRASGPRMAAASPVAATSTPAISDGDNNRSLLTQAETLRDSLGQAVSDTRELITLIKRNQKQNRLVETTLRSLKQLEHIGT